MFAIFKRHNSLQLFAIFLLPTIILFISPTHSWAIGNSDWKDWVNPLRSLKSAPSVSLPPLQKEIQREIEEIAYHFARFYLNRTNPLLRSKVRYTGELLQLISEKARHGNFFLQTENINSGLTIQQGFHNQVKTFFYTLLKERYEIVPSKYFNHPDSRDLWLLAMCYGISEELTTDQVALLNLLNKIEPIKLSLQYYLNPKQWMRTGLIKVLSAAAHAASFEDLDRVAILQAQYKPFLKVSKQRISQIVFQDLSGYLLTHYSVQKFLESLSTPKHDKMFFKILSINRVGQVRRSSLNEPNLFTVQVQLELAWGGYKLNDKIEISFTSEHSDPYQAIRSHDRPQWMIPLSIAIDQIVEQFQTQYQGEDRQKPNTNRDLSSSVQTIGVDCESRLRSDTRKLRRIGLQRPSKQNQ